MFGSQRPVVRGSALLAVVSIGALTSVGTAQGMAAPAATGSLSVTLTSPTSSMVSGSVILAAMAQATVGVGRVDFLVDGAVVASDSSSPFTVTGDSRRFADGAKTVSARVVDKAGASAVSASRAVTIRNTTSPAPTPTPTATPAPTASPTPTGAPVPEPQSSLESRYSAPASGIFGLTSEWRRSLVAAPFATDSPTLVASLAKQVANYYGGVAAFNAYGYNTTVSVAASDEPRTNVVWTDCQHKGYTPSGLIGPGGQFTDVPIPAGTVVATGSDKELTVYSPSTDQLWEFWVAYRSSGVWHACWGGRIDHVSSSPGYFTKGFGATATGLPNAGGMVSFADVKRGYIDHALSLQVMDAAQWYQISYPAQRGDGQGSGPIREGQRFRLDPSVNVDALNLNPVAKMVARAAQMYGFIVTDKGGAVAVLGESGNNLTANGGADPWRTILGGTPSYAALKNFPWTRLQALPVDYGKPAATTTR